MALFTCTCSFSPYLVWCTLYLHFNILVWFSDCEKIMTVLQLVWRRRLDFFKTFFFCLVFSLPPPTVWSDWEMRLQLKFRQEDNFFLHSYHVVYFPWHPVIHSSHAFSLIISLLSFSGAVIWHISCSHLLISSIQYHSHTLLAVSLFFFFFKCFSLSAFSLFYAALLCTLSVWTGVGGVLVAAAKCSRNFCGPGIIN